MLLYIATVLLVCICKFGLYTNSTYKKPESEIPNGNISPTYRPDTHVESSIVLPESLPEKPPTQNPSLNPQPLKRPKP